MSIWDILTKISEDETTQELPLYSDKIWDATQEATMNNGRPRWAERHILEGMDWDGTEESRTEIMRYTRESIRPIGGTFVPGCIEVDDYGNQQSAAFNHYLSWWAFTQASQVDQAPILDQWASLYGYINATEES